MTEKLYYKDAYIKEFKAEVVDSVTDQLGIAVILDKTAFFPEEGGQSADNGYILDARVVDVREKNGVIYHYVDRAIDIGRSVECKLDFAERFEKMQCHTAEHILSGAIKKLYGLDNVGFHLGDVAVTMDVNGYLTREQLDEVELIANRAVFDNVPVNTFFPDREALATLNYRSKLELVDNVRIVEIEGYDMCACCAPHVARTGEIGMIKILDYERHRGGIRINIAAGYRALRDYKIKYLNAQRISAVFSSPQDVIADAAENFYKEAECLKSELKRAKVTGARLNAMLIKKTEGSYVFYNSEYTVDELREVVNTAKSSVGGIIIALSGNEGNYKLVMSSESVELSTIYKKILSDLGGKGGGRDNMIQGSVTASLDEIKAYFENFKQ